MNPTNLRPQLVTTFVLLTSILLSTSALASAIGLIQYNADRHFGDVSTNQTNLESLALEAIAQGATTIVLPEGSTHGYATAQELWCKPRMRQFNGRSCRDVSHVAEVIPGGPTTVFWHEFAKLHNVTVVYSIKEVSDNKYYNTAGVVDPRGYVDHYRKRALYWVDTAYASPGASSLMLELEGIAFGFLTCMDANYDEYYKEYQDMGVENILLTMDWDQDPWGGRAAALFFQQQANRHTMNIFASDQSQWDGTGLYLHGSDVRVRHGIIEPGVGVDGYSIHRLTAQ